MATIQRIAPCLWLDGTADAAAAFYTALFPRSRVLHKSRYGKEGFEHHGQPEGQTLVADLELDGFRMCVLNGGPMFKINPSISFFVERDSETEVARLWSGLADGGTALMPLDAYPWSAKYGWVADRFGMTWQISLRNPDTAARGSMALALLFTGDRAGRAEAAIKRYSAIFAGSGIDAIARHDGSGPDATGTVLAARFHLGGQPFLAMDSAHAHAFGFNEGVSLMVSCDTQPEIDQYWSALIAEGGAESMCGWLKDRFGVSWQIVPSRLPEMMANPDRAAASRMMSAIFGMRKLDIATLEAAFSGTSHDAQERIG